MTEQEYFDSFSEIFSTSKYSKPLYKCPKCGKLSVCRREDIVFTSDPPKSMYECLSCGYNTIR